MSSLFEIIVSPIKGPLFLIRVEVHKAKVYRTWIKGDITRLQQQDQKTLDIGMCKEHI